MVLAGLMRNTKQVCVAADGKTKGEIQGSFTAFRMTTLEALRSDDDFKGSDGKPSEASNKCE
jgi:hypothetical protein